MSDTNDTKIKALEERVAKLEKGTSVKVKKVKIPKDQRPPPKGYKKFVSEFSAIIRKEWEAESKTFKQPDIMKECGKRWKALTVEAQDDYKK